MCVHKHSQVVFGVTGGMEGHVVLHIMRELEVLSFLLFYSIEIIRIDSPLLNMLKLRLLRFNCLSQRQMALKREYTPF